MRSGAFRAAWSRTRSQASAMKVSLTSEPRDVGARHAPVAHVHAAPLGAAPERGHRLAGIEDAGRVEGALHGVEGFDLGRAELHAHLAQLLDAHAVLAGDRAAHLHAALEDPPAQFLGVLQVAGAIRV